MTGTSSPRSLLNLGGSPNSEVSQHRYSYEANIDDSVTLKANSTGSVTSTLRSNSPIGTSQANGLVSDAQSEPGPLASGRVEVLTYLEQLLNSDEVNKKRRTYSRDYKVHFRKGAQSGHGLKEPDPKRPIKLKNAAERDSTFPFQLCHTWAGMEEFLRHAFMHVEVLELRVAEGHSDLPWPNGEIILPQV